jgi:ribosomal protein S18 acetylase RimI-like enzyme
VSAFTIRAAHPDDDTQQVLDLWRAAAENHGRPTDDDAHLLGGLLRLDPDALLLAEIDGALIGSVIAGWDGWRAHLYRLAVRPEFRRQGVGSALLQAAERRLTGLGARRLDAMVLDANDLGRQVWQAAGYHRQDDWGRWVKPVAR